MLVLGWLLPLWLATAPAGPVYDDVPVSDDLSAAPLVPADALPEDAPLPSTILPRPATGAESAAESERDAVEADDAPAPSRVSEPGGAAPARGVTRRNTETEPQAANQNGPDDAPRQSVQERVQPPKNCWQLATGYTYASPQTQVYVPVSLDGRIPVGSVGGPALPSGSTHGASSARAPLSGSSPGNLSGEALVALVAVAAAVAPIIVYALDSEAERDVVRLYECPSFDVRLTAGMISSPMDGSSFRPVAGVRAAFAMNAVGLDASYEVSPQLRDLGSLDVHFQLRARPKKHIEGGLALGYRRVVFGGAERNGIEVALPHRYVITRVGARPLAVELMPGLFVGPNGADVRVEAALSIPAGPAQFQLGARVFSFDEAVRGGLFASVGLFL